MHPHPSSALLNYAPSPCRTHSSTEVGSRIMFSVLVRVRTSPPRSRPAAAPLSGGTRCMGIHRRRPCPPGCRGGVRATPRMSKRANESDPISGHADLLVIGVIGRSVPASLPHPRSVWWSIGWLTVSGGVRSAWIRGLSVFPTSCMCHSICVRVCTL